VYNKDAKRLEFHKTADPDRLSDKGSHLIPLLTIDILEHAYYNDRSKFLTEIWKIINWKKVEERFQAAKKYKFFF
jgi:Fe-Mn family superoxide dismutase